MSGKRKHNTKRHRSPRRKGRTSHSPRPGRSNEADDLLHRRLSGHVERIETLLAEADGDWSLVADRADAQVSSLVVQAQQALALWHPLDALAWLRMSNVPLNPETYQESTFQGSLAVVELAGLLLLARDPVDARVGSLPAMASLTQDGHDLADPGHVAQMCRDVIATLQEVLDVATVREIAGAMAAGEAARNEYIPIRMRSREVGLRNIEYEHKHRRALVEQFSRPGIAELVLQHCGFEMTDALAVLDVFNAQLNDAFHASIGHARTEIRAFREATDLEVVRLRESLGAETQRMERAFAMTVGTDRLGQRAARSAVALAELAGRPLDRVEAVLRAFSQRLRGPGFSAHAAVLDFLHGRNEWRLRPIVRTDDDLYYALDIGLMLFALREVAEASLPQNARPKYAKHTADWMEDTSIQALVDVLRPDRVLRNLEYIDRDGAARELDALIICDRVAIAVEAKGVGLSARARTGDALRLRRDLGRMVEDTLHQADRVRDAILSEGLIRQRGSDSPIDLKHIKRVLPIAVTLHDVTTIAGTVDELIRENVVAFDGTPPWLVSLHDLRVITDITEGPAQLLAYLDHHERLIDLSMLSVAEELDLFMLFLSEGLYMGNFLDEEGRPHTRLLLPSQTDALDAYYMFATGLRRTPAPKPRQTWNPPTFVSLLQRLERERPEGWTTAVINLQQVDDQVRKKLGGMPRWLIRRARESRTARNLTMCFQGPFTSASGISGLAGPPGSDRDDVKRLLDQLCRMRKHTQQAATWTGIGVQADAPDAPLLLVQLDEHWKPDAELDALIHELNIRPAREVSAPWGS
ncbi:hypothetical protein [Modestobacter sp. VKM Ac-2984]|uniref:hypothetical protein n=1 Tax=Modestobacter sp. VKM Ac-2984 TaxID=3004138 RepID=UPI0022AA32DD|nr:hypothetical protein [Modestobacter sp. VKM Ac-2984]MCZ2816765.1 hypothetical protein [Modestobacter sp. VKM Ac-2984]